MNVGGRNAPLSPVSVGGSDWPSDRAQPADDGPYFNGRANLASPPNSGGSIYGVMSMNGFPSGPRSGGPSPPPSVDRMSSGTNIYSRPDSGRDSSQPELNEVVMGEHYRAFRSFLNARDPNNKHQPNKARDKLLRLSTIQFYELSTDVYDELMRRQASARAPPNAPNGFPAFLLPEKTFHPKRNQARQRLSSLGHPRFRDLAADVFHELERRFPRFAGGDIPRVGSAMSMRGPMSRTGTPVNGAGFPPRGPNRLRRPSDASSIRGPPPPDAYTPMSPGLANGDFGRPMPKQLNQNNTIVPNKSTMLEEDDGNEDAFGLERVTGSPGRAGADASEADKKLIQDYQSQVRELRDKLDGMENAMKRKEDEQKGWGDLRQELEDKLAAAQNLNDSMKQELHRMRDDHAEEARAFREQLGSVDADAELKGENEQLRASLQEQRQVTEQVRREAQEFLREMRMLSQQSEDTYQRQVELEKTIESLEQEVQDWRGRYARTRTQLRGLRASSLGLALDQDVGENGFVERNGMVKDVHVTKFQIAVDELLQTARKDNPEKVVEAMKSVVVSVRHISKDLDSAPPQDHAVMQQKGKLKARVASTANNLITASKNFAAGAGLSPVSLLDAAASHLTAAVMDVLRTFKIRKTPAGDLDDDDDDDNGSIAPADSSGFVSPRSTTQPSMSQDTLPPPPPFQGLGGIRGSADSSAYSPVSSPRESVEPYPRRGANGIGYLGHNSKNLSSLANGYGDDMSEELKASHSIDSLYVDREF